MHSISIHGSFIFLDKFKLGIIVYDLNVQFCKDFSESWYRNSNLF